MIVHLHSKLLVTVRDTSAVIASSGTDLYQRLQLQFYVLLMIGAMGAQNI